VLACNRDAIPSSGNAVTASGSHVPAHPRLPPISSYSVHTQAVDARLPSSSSTPKPPYRSRHPRLPPVSEYHSVQPTVDHPPRSSSTPELHPSPVYCVRIQKDQEFEVRDIETWVKLPSGDFRLRVAWRDTLEKEDNVGSYHIRQFFRKNSDHPLYQRYLDNNGPGMTNKDTWQESTQMMHSASEVRGAMIKNGGEVWYRVSWPTTEEPLDSIPDSILAEYCKRLIRKG